VIGRLRYRKNCETRAASAFCMKRGGFCYGTSRPPKRPAKTPDRLAFDCRFSKIPIASLRPMHPLAQRLKSLYARSAWITGRVKAAGDQGSTGLFGLPSAEFQRAAPKFFNILWLCQRFFFGIGVK
jgi:hypothetical protein